MKNWLITYYTTSTFNKSPHKQLLGMISPAIKVHVDPQVKPVVVHTSATVPLHWQDQVEQQINDDISLGKVEKVLAGEPSLWCHKMILVCKADVIQCKTVDLSQLNHHCLHETLHVKPPYPQAKHMPPNTWKSVTDTWNGYHSIPIHKYDCHLITFIILWGCLRCEVGPQGFFASSTKWFDEIMRDAPWKTQCVDDTALYDEVLEQHWWKMIDFLELLGQHGIILNRKKFQFSEQKIEFAGFRISEYEIHPLEKFLIAIRNFPTPTKLSNIRLIA